MSIYLPALQTFCSSWNSISFGLIEGAQNIGNIFSLASQVLPPPERTVFHCISFSFRRTQLLLDKPLEDRCSPNDQPTTKFNSAVHILFSFYSDLPTSDTHLQTFDKVPSLPSLQALRSRDTLAFVEQDRSALGREGRC